MLLLDPSAPSPPRGRPPHDLGPRHQVDSTVSSPRLSLLPALVSMSLLPSSPSFCLCSTSAAHNGYQKPWWWSDGVTAEYWAECPSVGLKDRVEGEEPALLPSRKPEPCCNDRCQEKTLNRGCFLTQDSRHSQGGSTGPLPQLWVLPTTTPAAWDCRAAVGSAKQNPPSMLASHGDTVGDSFSQPLSCTVNTPRLCDLPRGENSSCRPPLPWSSGHRTRLLDKSPERPRLQDGEDGLPSLEDPLYFYPGASKTSLGAAGRQGQKGYWNWLSKFVVFRDHKLGAHPGP